VKGSVLFLPAGADFIKRGRLLMVRWVPIILGVVALLGFTFAEARMSGRFQSSNMTEEEFATILKRVPMDIGEWQGTDTPVDDRVKQVSGAKGYVSRSYKNNITGDEVSIWLIVGHSKDVVRHTPDVCYPSSGFTQRAPENSLQPFVFDGKTMGDFYTNSFTKEDGLGRQLVRVFWSWYKPTDESGANNVDWKAPKFVRYEFGNTPSLYKLYFTSKMRDIRETTDQSVCLKFAEEFLPVVNKALGTPLDQPAASGAPAEAAAETPATT
jgi:hypothetical protein